MRQEPSEDALMAAYAAGDGRAFDRLFARLAPKVLHFFMRTFHNRATADDLVQTTFLKVHRARKDYSRERPVLPWLFTIAARVRIDELRKQKPREAAPLDEESDAVLPAVAVTPEQSIDNKALAQEVQTALASLTEDQRLIVHLHRFEGLTFGEIGQILGITEGAAKLRAFRGYERLRKQLRTPTLDREETTR